MVGLVIITHGKVGEELVKVAKGLLEKEEEVIVLSLNSADFQNFSKDVEEALKKVDRGDGVMVLTDMWGGITSRLTVELLKRKNLEVVTGVNLPMVIKALEIRHSKSLPELTEFIKEYGQRNITVASEIIKVRK